MTHRDLRPYPEPCAAVRRRIDDNLRALAAAGATWLQLGVGERLMLLWAAGGPLAAEAPATEAEQMEGADVACGVVERACRLGITG